MTTATSAATRVLAALLHARTGQHLSPSRMWRIEASLKPVMADLAIESLDVLVGRLAGGGEPALANRVVEALLNNETSFFRDAGVWQMIEQQALPRLREAATTRRLRVWSAACSSGQELYSLAMMLGDAAATWAGWSVDLLGTDVSPAIVQRARAGSFSQFEIQRGLPVRTMLRWFGQDGVEWVASDALRRAVRFATHSLLEPPPARFDLIFCRNVMMYFPPEQRRLAFDRLADALVPGGLLVLGAGETVIGQTERFVSHPEMRGMYAPADDICLSPRAVNSR